MPRSTPPPASPSRASSTASSNAPSIPPSVPPSLFDWRALLLAPAVVPALGALALVIASPGSDPFSGFLFWFAIGSLVSYGATLVLLLPALHLLARFATPGVFACGLLGSVLAIAIYLPLIGVMYQASGPDSGPPEGSFIDYLLRDLGDPLTLFFPAAGFITAALYRCIATCRPRVPADDRNNG